jgi:hypothetical protein
VVSPIPSLPSFPSFLPLLGREGSAFYFYVFSSVFYFSLCLRTREDRAGDQNKRQQSSAEKPTHGASFNAEANAYRQILILGDSRVNQDDGGSS